MGVDGLLCGAALLVPDEHDRDLLDRGQTGDDGGILPEATVAVQLEKPGRYDSQVVERVRTPRVPRELHALPAREPRENVVAQLLGPSLEALQLLLHLGVRRRPRPAQ